MKQNYAQLIAEGLPAPVFKLIESAGQAALSMAYGLHLVGGIVRDLMIGRPNLDIDLMVEGDAIHMAKVISKEAGGKPTIHIKFGTVTFKLGEYRIDLATCRSETYSRPGALPDVKPGDISADLFRRDFTINAMAICVNPDRFGELIDLYGGVHDLEAGIIRVLHDRSFQDDATRIMRAVRYEQRLNFKLEGHTEKLLRRDLGMLDTISGDRLRHEVMLWLSEPQPEGIIKRAARLGILSGLHPALSWVPHSGRAFRAARKGCSASYLTHLYLALFLYNLDKKQLEQLLRRLNIQGGELYDVTSQTLSLKNKLGTLDDAIIQPSEIYLKLKGFNTLAIRANALCAASRQVRKNLELYLDKLRLIKTRLNGKDLAEMGVPESRQVGIVLERLLIAKLDGEVRTKADEESLVRQLVRAL